MTRVYLIRHGQTTGNAQNTFQGSTDCALSDLGREQAAFLGERCRSLPIDAVYSSPLSRAFDTAQAVAAHHKLEVGVVPEIAEMSCGKWEGQSFADIAENDAENLAFWRTTPHLYQSPGGESMVQVYARMKLGIMKIVAESKGKTVAIVSHGCAIRTFLCVAHGFSLEKINDMPWVENTSVTCIDFDDNLAPSVVFENDSTHIL